MEKNEFYDKKSGVYELVASRGTAHRKILDNIGTGKIVLDVGCSKGYLGAEIKKKGNKVYGVEISEVAAKEATKVLDDVIIGNIEDIALPFNEGYFDLIVCADILEHLYDPQKVMMKLKRHLKDDGIFIASVPNIANWSVRMGLLFGKFDYGEYGLLDSGHIRFFTLDSAKKMIHNAGYRIERFDITVCLARGLNRLVVLLGVDKMFAKIFAGLFAGQFIFFLKKITGSK